jgi:hypothetical protein
MEIILTQDVDTLGTFSFPQRDGHAINPGQYEKNRGAIPSR